MPTFPGHVQIVILLTIEILAVLTLLELIKLLTAGRTLRQFPTGTFTRYSH
jgi:hypothetical protein